MGKSKLYTAHKYVLFSQIVCDADLTQATSDELGKNPCRGNMYRKPQVYLDVTSPGRTLLSQAWAWAAEGLVVGGTRCHQGN
jgi:hypothetical protein